jgi:hypothetical protein
VTIAPARVTVRWRPGVAADARAALEQQYSLRGGEPTDGTTWRYEVGDRSRETIAALVKDAAVEDTGNIDRDALTVPRSTFAIGLRALPFPLHLYVDRPSELPQLQATLWLWGAGLLLLRAARTTALPRRRGIALAALLLVCTAGWLVPISPAVVQMGDATQAVQSRYNWETYAGVHSIRFEAHLSYAVLDRLDALYGRTDDAPARAQLTLARAATAWFVLCALCIGFLERWSPLVVRYLALAVLAPAALMYFGWREIGYLSLNVAAFPLLARGLADGGWRLDAGGALLGFGAALHGYGLVGVLGAWTAAAVARARLSERVDRLLRVAAWVTAAYLGWVALYVIVLKRPIILGHAEYFPWRPWLGNEMLEGRLNVAILSLTGARDLFVTGVMVGAPLLIVAATLWRRQRDEVRMAMAYAAASVVFTVLIWPIQGLGEEMDLVFTGFPAVYALAWVCAHEATRTRVAAALLAAAHFVFWFVVLDGRFVNAPLR